MEQINPSYGKEVRPIEEKRMEKELKKAALPDEAIAEVSGGLGLPDQFADLDIWGMMEEPLRASSEAQAKLAEAVRAFMELEIKEGWNGGRKKTIAMNSEPAMQARRTVSRVCSVLA